MRKGLANPSSIILLHQFDRWTDCPASVYRVIPNDGANSRYCPPVP